MPSLQSNMYLWGDEIIKNFKIRYKKHKEIRKESEPEKYLIENLSQKLKWKSLLKAEEN